jgi:hypothetical protein
VVAGEVEKTQRTGASACSLGRSEASAGVSDPRLWMSEGGGVRRWVGGRTRRGVGGWVVVAVLGAVPLCDPCKRVSNNKTKEMSENHSP